MSSRKPKVAAPKRRELQVAAAVAREAVMQLHVARATKLIELGGDRVSAPRMLGIYLRLQEITSPAAELLVNRVLAMLGQRTGKGPVPSLFVEGEDDTEPNDQHRSWIRVVRERLRGRVHDDLRRWVELHTGATQVAVLDTHVRHARRFVQDLSDSHNIEAACALYCELAEVPASMHSTVYMFVLDRMAAEELPRPKGKRGQHHEGTSIHSQFAAGFKRAEVV